MLKALPVEFGLTTGNAVANFRHEIVLSGTPGNNGYATRLGMPDEWARKRSGTEHFVYMPYPIVALNVIAQALRPQWNVGNGQRICEDVSLIDYEGGENVGDIIRREHHRNQSNVYLYYEIVILNLLFSHFTLLNSPRPLLKQMVAA